MWIFTELGFFSVVCAHTKDHQPDPDKIMVRARDRQHLVNLQRKFAIEQPIQENTGTDYAYRMILCKPHWVAILSQLAGEQDYSNFKNEAARNVKQTSREYVAALHEIWEIMFDFQSRTSGRKAARRGEKI